MWSRSGFFVEPAAASGLMPLRSFPCSDLRTFLISRPLFARATSQSFSPSYSTGPIPMREMKLQDLKAQTPAELVSFAEEKGVEKASTMSKQELMFAIIKKIEILDTAIFGVGDDELLT